MKILLKFELKSGLNLNEILNLNDFERIARFSIIGNSHMKSRLNLS